MRQHLYKLAKSRYGSAWTTKDEVTPALVASLAAAQQKAMHGMTEVVERHFRGRYFSEIMQELALWQVGDDMKVRSLL